jgi:hypothetical protein
LPQVSAGLGTYAHASSYGRTTTTQEAATVTIAVTLTQTGVGRTRRWEARIGDLTADGTTKTEAKEAVEALAVAALRGDTSPRLLRVPNSPLFLLVWREPGFGWCYKVVCDGPPAPPTPQRLWGTTGGYDGLADAERNGRQHLAHVVYDLHGLAAAFSVLVDVDDRAELARWIGFQRAYKAAVSADEADPHRWAGEHGHQYAPQVPAA